MKDETITGSTDRNGLFKPLCIYHCENLSNYTCFELPDASICNGCRQVEEYLKHKPPLFCYNENNELVKGVEGLEVKGPVWQYKNYDKWLYYPEKELFVNYAEYKAFMNNTDIDTRHVYIAVQPTEKAEPITNDNFFIMATFSDVPIVNEYFKDIQSMYHDGEITIAIEKFALWLENKNPPKNL